MTFGRRTNIFDTFYNFHEDSLSMKDNIMQNTAYRFQENNVKNEKKPQEE